MLVAFHLHRKPVSLNAKPNPVYAREIAAQARSSYGGPMMSCPLYSRIIWFHKYRSSQGDVDNIAKRIHDALKGVLFLDDGLITHTMAVRVDAAERVDLVADPDYPARAEALVDSLDDESVRDILYIEIGRQSDPKIRLGPLA